MATRILLSVDDNPTIRLLVAGALKPFDCAVSTAANGEEGLTAAAREKPDLIILDICMPVMDGIEMLTNLRKHPELARVPVIMLTAWSGEERVEQISRLGVQDYLVKPFTKEQLLEKVAAAVTLEPKPGKPDSRPPAAHFLPPVAARSKGASAAKSFGLDATPESVARLANLVTHQEVDLDEIAKVIAQDESLTTRLLRLANAHRRPDDEEIESVEAALSRNGIGSVFLLAMGDLAMRALVKTFQTMLGISLEGVPAGEVEFTTGAHVLSEVNFSGKALGSIKLHLEPLSAAIVTARMLGLDAGKAASPRQIDDTICELTNMVVGNFLSNLSDAGLKSRLSSPRVRRTLTLSGFGGPGRVAERLVFRSSEIVALLDISVDPWNE